MDKLAYHYNKKKIPAETAGKYLYYYPCADVENATVQMGGRGYITIEVTDKEWESLIELDRIEYNNEHKYVRHTTVLPDEDGEISVKEQEQLHTDETPIPTATAEKMDKEALFSKLSEDDRQILNLLENENQKQIAEKFGVTQGYVSTLKKRAQYNLDYLEYKDAVRTKDSGYIWKCWDMFTRKLEMPLFADVELEFILSRLNPKDLQHFMYWYYSFGELIRFSLAYYIYNEKDIEKDLTYYITNASDQEIDWFKSNYADEPVFVQIVYIRLITEFERRRQNGLKSSSKAIDGLRTAIEKLAEKVNMPPEQFYMEKVYPIISFIRQRRYNEYHRFYTGKNLKK